ncbi:MAG TPA: FUSC family protein [Steroidobacteraceae bacterium]|jgi:multidrug resistance protein MdtO|nr:FUSC family protein [Steroidobacteraceae bacterium]
MTALADSQRSRPFLEVLAVELAWREGRWAAVARIASGATITVIIAMVFQIPQPTYMAYIGFLISKDEKSGTVTTSLGGLAAATLAVVLVLGLELIDTSEPALRLPLMAVATFVAMYTARTFALGPISFLAGFVIVLLQSVVDDVRSPEALTHLTLWTWVVIFVPVAVTIIVNLLFGQGALTFMNRSVRKVLSGLETSLANGEYRKYLAEWRAQLLSLLEIAQHNPQKGPRAGRITVPVIRALVDTLVIFEALPDELPADLQEELARRLRACRQVIESGAAAATQDPPPPPAQLVGASGEPSPAVIGVRSALSALWDTLVRPAAPADNTQAHRPPRRLFVADAFSNPAHWQFALKTTMAVMISYAIYSLVAWPGMRTAIVTCFFVALSSLGETVHKLLLRLSGAVIGGLIAGVCIVFVLPHLTDIGQLCLLVFTVSVGAAWVSTSSELLAYAGMQIAFAFFLGILQGYAPATDLTVLRDRVAGILLGNIVITIIFSSLWPQSARSAIRAAIADSLRAIGEVIRRPRNAGDARLRTVQALARADHLRTLTLFELRMLPSHTRESLNVPSVASVERLAGAAFVVTTDAISPYAESASTARLAAWAESAADNVSSGRSVLPSPAPDFLLPTAVERDARLGQYAIEQLELEAQHVASAAH